MDTLTYNVAFDVELWSHRWTCTHPGCTDTGLAESRHAAEVIAQAHAETHAVRRGW